jgi:hypothetical protein
MASMHDRGLDSAGLTIIRIGIMLIFAAVIAKGEMIDLRLALGFAILYVLLTQIIVVIRVYDEMAEFSKELEKARENALTLSNIICDHIRKPPPPAVAKPVVFEGAEDDEEEELDPTVTDEHNQRLNDLEFEMSEIRNSLMDCAQGEPEMTLREFCRDLIDRLDGDKTAREAESRSEG